MRSLVLNTTRADIDGLDEKLDTKSKKPIPVPKELLRKLVMDHRHLAGIVAESYVVIEPEEE
jgi:hypothetical protein